MGNSLRDEVDIKALEAAIRILSAKSEIQDCVHRYARGIDRDDDALVRSAFFPDATISHAMYSGDPEGFAVWVRQRMTALGSYSHVITNHLADVAGDTAYAESYGTIFTVGKDTPTLNVWGVRYIDQFECRDGCWKIARRQFVMDWFSPAVSSNDGTEFIRSGRYLLGTRDPNDPSYARPLEPRT